MARDTATEYKDNRFMLLLGEEGQQTARHGPENACCVYGDEIEE
jgi:hypothetical protein